VLAIEKACRMLSRLELSDCWLIATAEPCPMCAATASLAKIKRIAFGAGETSVRNVGYDTLHLNLFDFMCATQTQFQIYDSVLEAECVALLRSFPAKDQDTSLRFQNHN
jgi:tRNA(Arg) A34 adenosine deaminase TadA